MVIKSCTVSETWRVSSMQKNVVFTYHLVIFTQIIWQSYPPIFGTMLGPQVGEWLPYWSVTLISDYQNVYDHNPPTSQTDRWTDRRHSHSNTMLCTYLLRTVKNIPKRVSRFEHYINECHTGPVSVIVMEKFKNTERLILKYIFGKNLVKFKTCFAGFGSRPQSLTSSSLKYDLFSAGFLWPLPYSNASVNVTLSPFSAAVSNGMRLALSSTNM